jgi:4'-phosphopantetheinyl transferase EntD
MMISKILPSDVSSFEVHGEFEKKPIWPEESVSIKGAVEKRATEFAMGRFCARNALSRLGLPPAPIPVGPNREPQWPVGIAGSITHCKGYCSAAVARIGSIVGIGIDAEIDEPIPLDVLSLISNPSEIGAINELSAGTHWDKLLFSAKESVFKALFPLTAQWLDFKNVGIVFSPNDGSFIASVPSEGTRNCQGKTLSLRGRYLIDRGLIVTAVVVPLSRVLFGAWMESSEPSQGENHTQGLAPPNESLDNQSADIAVWEV